MGSSGKENVKQTIRLGKSGALWEIVEMCVTLGDKLVVLSESCFLGVFDPS